MSNIESSLGLNDYEPRLKSFATDLGKIKDNFPNHPGIIFIQGMLRLTDPDHLTGPISVTWPLDLELNEGVDTGWIHLERTIARVVLGIESEMTHPHNLFTSQCFSNKIFGPIGTKLETAAQNSDVSMVNLTYKTKNLTFFSNTEVDDADLEILQPINDVQQLLRGEALGKITHTVVGDYPSESTKYIAMAGFYQPGIGLKNLLTIFTNQLELTKNKTELGEVMLEHMKDELIKQWLTQIFYMTQMTVKKHLLKEKKCECHYLYHQSWRYQDLVERTSWNDETYRAVELHGVKLIADRNLLE